MRLFLLLVAVAAFAGLVLSHGGGQASAQTPSDTPVPTPIVGNVWVSLDSGDSQLTGPSGNYSYSPSITADGNFVAYQSLATYSRDGDENNVEDVFRRDINANATLLISVAADGKSANNRSYAPDISADANLVVFESLASNLAAGDGNNAADIFLRDIAAGTTTRISAAAAGADTNAASFRPALSSNGGFIAFCSRATNLVAGDKGGPAGAYVFDRAAGAITKIPLDLSGGATAGCSRVAISDDGGVVAIAAENAGRSTVYAFERPNGAVTALTATADSSSGLGGLAISGDGKLVAFDSSATNLVSDDTNLARDVFVEKLSDKTITRASLRTDGSQLPDDSGMSGVAISGDGRVVVFGSTADEVVPGDSNKREDVFRRELATGETTAVSVNISDRPTNDSSYSPDVNTDGSRVVFAALGANLYNGDTNRQPDIYMRVQNFPAKLGEAAKAETGPRIDDTAIKAGVDNGNAKTLTYVGIAAGVVIALLLGSSLLAGRRGRA